MSADPHERPDYPRPALSHRNLLALHRTMVTIRLFEERVIKEYTARRIPGFTHSYIGEEAIAAGACMALRESDQITSTHRGHGHAIAKGVDLDSMMAELYGKSTGTCRGYGGSMHIADFSKGMLGANGIVGGGFGIAVGSALASQLLQSGDVTLCFFGDGAINKGSFHEALNVAAVRALPVVFLCENNQFAQFTAVERMTSVTDLASRAASYGMPGTNVDGMDVVAVCSAVQQAVQRASNLEGPSLIVAETYRFHGHQVGDAEAYRTKEAVATWKLRDPITRFESWLVAHQEASAEQLGLVWIDVESQIDSAVDFAEASPEPAGPTALDSLYAESVAAWAR